jgi:hypothetical protein
MITFTIHTLYGADMNSDQKTMYRILDAEGDIRMITDVTPVTEVEGKMWIKMMSDRCLAKFPNWIPFQLVRVGSNNDPCKNILDSGEGE